MVLHKVNMGTWCFKNECTFVARSDETVQMVSTHSVQSSSTAVVDGRKTTRSSFFRSSSIIRAPADIKKIKEYFQGDVLLIHCQ